MTIDNILKIEVVQSRANTNPSQWAIDLRRRILKALYISDQLWNWGVEGGEGRDLQLALKSLRIQLRAATVNIDEAISSPEIVTATKTAMVVDSDEATSDSQEVTEDSDAGSSPDTTMSEEDEDEDYTVNSILELGDNTRHFRNLRNGYAFSKDKVTFNRNRPPTPHLDVSDISRLGPSDLDRWALSSEHISHDVYKLISRPCKTIEIIGVSYEY